MKTKTVKVTYKFKIGYDHESHLKQITKDLMDDPIFEMRGAGVVGNKAYSYSCKRVGKGKVEPCK